MPKRSYPDDFVSRTQSARAKASTTKNSNSSRPRKRRRRGGQDKVQDQTSRENSFSALLNIDESDKGLNNKVNQDLAFDSFQARIFPPDMDGLTFGRNRLASGFSRPPTNNQQNRPQQQTNPSTPNDASTGQSPGSPIEISDDDMEETEGGMIINIDQDTSPAQPHSSDEESGEIVSTPVEHSTGEPDALDLFVVDPTSAIPVKRLLDLSSEELEEQLKYVFFHLARDRIDLSRPVVCLACSSEGHLHDNCTQKSQERFPAIKIDPEKEIKLWISCCICASKSHLVGDCPKSQRANCGRWSLKDLNPQQVTNLSFEKGIGNRQKEAGNAGIRPPGLQIKGRASLHRTGIPDSENSSGEIDEPFLRKPVGRRQADNRAEPTQPDRYDRYNPPSDRSYQGGGQWYATDSFGQRRPRSRSPDDRYSYRPRDDYGRSTGFDQRDNWRPDPGENRREPHRQRAQSPPRQNRAPTTKARDKSSNGSGSKFQFPLPTRKGSNTWSQNGQSGTSTPNSNSNPGNSHSKKPARHKKKGKKAS